MNKLLSIFITLIPCFLSSYEYNLSICAIFQDEAPYLKEWIDYHVSVGVEHFILYNNNSSDDYSRVLVPYVDQRIVEVIQWTSENKGGHDFVYNVQCKAYENAIHRSKGISKWLALIDIDEFIVPVQEKTIVECLENNFSHASGLCVNWQCYGTSHIDKFPEGKMLENLTRKMRWNHDWNKHSKSIVQPLHVLNCPNPHYCSYNSNHWAIDGNYNRCNSIPNTVIIDKIRINHYWTRDEWFFYNVKIKKWGNLGADKNGLINHAFSMNEEYDPILSYPSSR